MSNEAVKLMNQADRARREHRLADAERDLSEAVGLGRAAAARRELANAIRPLAILKDDAGEVKEARRLWEEARELYAGVDGEAGVAESSARLARLAHRRESAE